MAQITEDYVSYETSKLLKEKGFDAECKKYYTLKMLSNLYYGCEYVRNRDLKDEDDCIAPTIQMAMKWLREIHHCVICITPLTFYCGEIVSAWGCNIWADDNLEVDEESTPKFITYEEACEYSIQYCLEKLI